MSLSIFECGDGRFRLFHGDREIGWVEGRVVGFTGFDSDAAAVRAATIAHDALSAWLARQSYTEVVKRRGRPLSVHVRYGERHLTIAGVSIGRLVSGPADLAANIESVGFELSLPPRIGDALTAAQVADRALLENRKTLGLEKAVRVEPPEAHV
jgi:hypothetical protein